MNRFFIFLLAFSFFTVALSAQGRSDSIPISQKDSLSKPDTTVANTQSANAEALDSICLRPEKHDSWKINPYDKNFVQEFNRQILQRHPYFGFGAEPLNLISNKKVFKGKDLLFYVLIFLLLVFAILKRLFPKYFTDLFRLFFRTTLKQKQIKEQLMQSPLPSLLFNGFFVVTAALYVDFLLQYFKLRPIDNFWLLFAYCGLSISGIYLVKFLGLKISGWIFNTEETTNSYVFIVFIVCKMMAIFLLPFLILLAFTQGSIYEISLLLSLCGIGVLFIYRFILSYNAVRNQIKVNPFHFFIYFCAFEIAPLLLIYKVLLYFFQ